MNSLKIIITIIDPETVAEYADVADDIIIDDFLDDPEIWGLTADKIEVERG